MIDATADKNGLTISTTGNIRMRIHAKGLDSTKVSQTSWDLPGLKIAVTSDPHGPFSIEKADENLNEYFKVTDNMIDLVYPGITNMRLEIKPDADR
jgi:hypothetical protein